MNSPATDSVDQLAINTLRFLSVDMVEKANSGHPGAPMGQAAMAYLLWTRYLRVDPQRPDWPDRDRFVLSCGHASALLYSLLHLSGYDLPMAELQRFRQLGSKTAGHPEHGLAPGIETTTGPLGQGLATAVGMAMAETLLAARFNRPEHALFDHRTWVIASDGDLMEGISSEASSMAGFLRLGKLNVLYDDNEISIDGSTDLSFTEDVPARYEAYGWHVQRVADGNDLAALAAAMEAAIAESGRPSLIAVRTHIGYGSPHKQDSSAAHGSPLGAEEVRLTKEALGWPLEPTFFVPEEARQAFAAVGQRGARQRAAWEEAFAAYRAAFPAEAAEIDRRLAGELPEGWDADLPTFEPGGDKIATRKASGKVLNALAAKLPEMVGGSADLTPSNNTYITGEPAFAPGAPARNLHFGVREHAMGAVLNGLALSGMFRPYGGTFLIFSDYMRPAMRLAALMRQPTLYVLTHDSIFLGEDGPTHQPISQILSMRSIPHMTVLRPADAWETLAAWKTAIQHRGGPTCLILTRQSLPVFEQTRQRAAEGVPRGGYVLADPADGAAPQALILATGSEVTIALEAHRALAADGIATRVVSLPSWELFAAQDRAYRDAVLLPSVRKRLAVEAGSPIGWHRWVGDEGETLCQETFGESAPAPDLARHFGFTAEEVARRVRALLAS
jgi:transketolase